MKRTNTHILLFVLTFFISNANCHPETINEDRKIQTKTQEVKIEIDKILEEALGHNISSSIRSHAANLSFDCIEDLKIILTSNNSRPTRKRLGKEFRKNTVLQMIDASAKVGPGIFLGRKVFSGLYRECIAIHERIQGRTRTLDGGFGRLFIDRFFRNYSYPNACAVDQFGPSGFGFDICVPKTCSNSHDLLQLGRSVRVNGITPVCAAYSLNGTKQDIDYKTWIVVFFMTTVILIAVSATICDYFTLVLNRKRKFVQYFYAFSLCSSLHRIFATYSSNKTDRVKIVDFFRFLALSWILGGHTLMTGLIFTSNPLELLRRTHTDIILLIFANSYLAVDIFFFFSGLLLGYCWFKQYFRNGRVQLRVSTWALYYVHRLIRLSPAYYILIAFYTFVFRALLRDMPNFQIDYPENCKKNWWINVLYLQNIIDYEHQCYFPTWYLATDLQMYIFAPLFLTVLAVTPWWGFCAAISALACSTAINMITVYAHFFPPSDYPFGGIDPRLEERKSYTFLIYQAPWIRCQIYIIGILTGYFLCVIKRLQINCIINILLWIVSLVNCFMVIYVLRDWISGKVMTPIASALYSAFSKILWGLSIAYITVSCHYGYGGLIGKFISSPYWAPFGRLTYSAYLVHFCVILWLVGMSDVQLTFSHSLYSVATLVLPALLLSYFAAVLFSVLFEVPSANLETILFKRKIRKDRRTGTDATSSETKNEMII